MKNTHDCKLNSATSQVSDLDSMVQGVRNQARRKDWEAQCVSTPDGRTTLTIKLTPRPAEKAKAPDAT